MNKRARRIKPFARPTSFDFNVRYDIQHYQSVKYNRARNPGFPPTQADSAMAVMEGEILVKKDANAQYTNSQLHVFSFANGLDRVTGDGGGADGINAAVEVLRGVKYMGVAVTGFNPGSDQYQQGFVATIAGLNTMFNNGQHTLYPGDTLCMDIPPIGERNGKQNRALQGGVPREKIQFVLTSKNKFDDKYRGQPINSANYIIGTCISYARPGDSVDVILHRVNHSIENAGDEGAGAARPPAFGPGTATLQPGPVDAAVGEPKSSKKSKKR